MKYLKSFSESIELSELKSRESQSRIKSLNFLTDFSNNVND